MPRFACPRPEDIRFQRRQPRELARIPFAIDDRAALTLLDCVLTVIGLVGLLAAISM